MWSDIISSYMQWTISISYVLESNYYVIEQTVYIREFTNTIF